MPRNAIDALVEERLDDTDGGGRYVDLRMDLVRKRGDELLCTVGGVWDTSDKVYVGESDRSKILRVEESQIDAARWLAEWIDARRAGEYLYDEEGEPVFLALLFGGRRGGKSNLGIKLCLLYCVAFPGSVVWIVIPAEADQPEVVDEIDLQLPLGWAKKHGDPPTWDFVNGSSLVIRSSAGDPETLKKGRVDVLLYNEAQKQPKDALNMGAPGIIDRGGLVLLTANPPRSVRGEWVTELLERIKTRKAQGVAFELDPKKNPNIDHRAARAMRGILGDDDYEREIEGKFKPRKDVVFYAFSLERNVAPAGFVPLLGNRFVEVEEITPRITKAKLGRAHDTVHGADFQADPYVVQTALKFYEDPEDPDGFLVWYTNVWILERGTEEELIDAVELDGFTGDDALIPDATSDWQDAKHEKGKASMDVYRRRGWRNIYLPDEPYTRRNPPRSERLAIFNGGLRAATGKIRIYFDPAVAEMIRHVRLWETKGGFANTRSVHAHACDAASYPPCRFFPRRLPKGPVEYSAVERTPTARRRDLEVY